MNTSTRIDVCRNPSAGPDSIELYVWRTHELGDGSRVRSIAVDMTLRRIQEGTVHPPVLTITGAEAQHLMDSLWDAGFKPTQGAGSPGQVAALKAHLEDMRRLAMASLSQERPVKFEHGGYVGNGPRLLAGIINRDSVMPRETVERAPTLEECSAKFSNRSKGHGLPFIPAKPRRKGWLAYIRQLASFRFERKGGR